jgi:hypothetical protein
VWGGDDLLIWAVPAHQPGMEMSTPDIFMAFGGGGGGGGARRWGWVGRGVVGVWGGEVEKT